MHRKQKKHCQGSEGIINSFVTKKTANEVKDASPTKTVKHQEKYPLNRKIRRTEMHPLHGRKQSFPTYIKGGQDGASKSEARPPQVQWEKAQ